MSELGREAEEEGRLYFTGGATAVLLGWRPSTIDIDLVIRPESDAMLRAIPALKERLQVNVELASPDQFIPVPAGWEERSPVVTRIGRVTVRHYDLVAQALTDVSVGDQQRPVASQLFDACGEVRNAELGHAASFVRRPGRRR